MLGSACSRYVPNICASRPPLQVYLTSKDDAALLAARAEVVPAPVPSSSAVVYIDPAKTFQTIEGFGGAFTEAAAVTWRNMGEANQKRVIEAYFDPAKGHGYSLCRTHINSCDFSLGNYAMRKSQGILSSSISPSSATRRRCCR